MKHPALFPPPCVTIGDLPKAPPYTDASGQQITEAQFERDAIFEDIAKVNETRTRRMMKNIKKGR